MMRVYQAQDGRWLQLNMVRNDELMARMFTAMEAEDLLADDRFATRQDMWRNRAELGDAIAQIIAARTSDDWLARFEVLDVPVNRIALVEETGTDEQIRANGMVLAPEDDATEQPQVINHPIKVTSVPPAPPRRAPRLGEHSAEILGELGYDADAIRAMAEDGVI